MLSQVVSASSLFLLSSALVAVADDSTSSSKTYTHIIVGGGTAGLAVAARLTENAANSVLVLEAGIDGSNNPNITDLRFYGNAAGTQYDWKFATTPQQYASGQSVPVPRGKVLGGSSAINGAVFDRGHRFEYDFWAFFGLGWNWDVIYAASKKSEHFYPISNPNITYDLSQHGTSGPISVTNYPIIPEIFTGGVIPSVVAAGGIKPIDTADGDPTGIFLTPRSHEANSTTRSYSANGYYAPNQGRSNLEVRIQSLVTRIIWSTPTSTSNGLKVATGVKYLDATGTEVTVSARKVILSAGVYQSPQILELSGVGNPAVINPLGISTVVDLPGVGENLNDQSITFLSSAVKSPQNATVQQLVNFETPNQQLSTVDYARALQLLLQATPANTGLTAPLLRAHQALFLLNVPWIESFISPSLNFAQINLHPLSRGSVHINTTDPTASPRIDLALLRSEFDQFMLQKSIQRARQYTALQPLAGYLNGETRPGANVTSEAALTQFVKDRVLIAHHATGSCIMAPREDKGVVDSKLKVYGTSNVWVVDASIIPIQPAAHTEATVYAIAERASTWL